MIENAHYATHLLAATTLRNALAQLSLQEILLDKDSITREIQEALDEATQTWYLISEVYIELFFCK
jgi:regulator of protease activity HflC (stomatin/prohibitin superfamily)